MPNLENLLVVGFFLVGLGAIVATGIMTWRFVSGFTRLVDQNARTMSFTSALAEKMVRQHNELMSTMERMAEQHGEIIKAIECLIDKVRAMADKR